MGQSKLDQAIDLHMKSRELTLQTIEGSTVHSPRTPIGVPSVDCREATFQPGDAEIETVNRVSALTCIGHAQTPPAPNPSDREEQSTAPGRAVGTDEPASTTSKVTTRPREPNRDRKAASFAVDVLREPEGKSFAFKRTRHAGNDVAVTIPPDPIEARHLEGTGLPQLV